MDYDLDARTPPSRQSRPLAWLAAVSGLALALFMFGSPGAASPPGASNGMLATERTASGLQPDRVMTGSIVSTAPVRLVNMPIVSGQKVPLPQSERHLLIGLLFACFAVMAASGFALWRRGWRDLVQRARAEE